MSTAEVDILHTDPPPARRRLAGRKIMRWAVIGVLLVALVAFGIYHWFIGRGFVSTDDAYVNANITEVSAQVSGPVTRLYVNDQQRVKPDDPLFDIDPQPFQLAVEKARAELEAARQNVGQRGAAVTAARAAVAQREAELRNARATSTRAAALLERGIISKQQAENMQTQALTAEAAVRAAQAEVAQAQSALGRAGEQNAAVQSAAAALARAELDLQHTHVTAANGGTIANLTLRPGSMVQMGAPLFAIIADQEYWVDANFKETQLNRIRPQQNATVTVDMYPGREFKAIVQSLSGGSGAAFSLLPPQNATGNWVKVTQRVPVRVRIVDVDPNYPLRVGTTATVKVAVQ